MADEAARRQRLWLLGSSAVLAVAIAAIGIAIGTAGGGGTGNLTGRPDGIAATRALFAGIPQRGATLGSPAAPVTVTEFADLQCPYCGKSARDELPGVVRRYVRPGRVRLVFRGLAFIGRDSLRGARMAAAAALQGKLWQFVDLVYRNQGEENAGWLNEAYVRRVAAAAGLDVRRALADRGGSPATAFLAQAKAAAKVAGVQSTPAFVVAGPHGSHKVEGAGQVARAITSALAGS